MTDPRQHFQRKDGLLVVDMQWDFCPGGRLPVPDGNLVLPVLNEWMIAALELGIPVYASRDWHPRDHISFTNRGGPWPSHCIQDTDGAQFHPDLHRDDRIVVVTKGTRFDRDQNSAFDETGFSAQLAYDDVRRLYIGDLALDVCVLQSVLDALEAGLEVSLIRPATRSVDEEGGHRALQRMLKLGVTLLD